MKSLKLPCPGLEVQGQRGGQLSRMRKGRHPVKAEDIGPPRRVLSAAEDRIGLAVRIC